MNRKKIILSFDYELFFGEKSGTIKKTLIDPTNSLMDIMESCGLRGNFFIDFLMIKYLKKEDTQRTLDDARLIENQLKDMVKRGHRIELHIHSHWIDAKYNGDGTWNFDNYSHYSLSSLDRNEILNIFTEGTHYLNTIAQSIDKHYKICAFRAGGWAVQPFEKLREAFLKNGISVDSSSAYGMYSYHPNSYYDFRDVPNKPVYRFDTSVEKEDSKGQFIEVPITTMQFSLVTWFYLRFHRNLYPTGYTDRHTDGTHFRSDIVSPKSGILTKIFKKLFGRQMLQLSQHEPYGIKRFLETSNHEIYCLIDHPKDFSNATVDGLKAIGNECISTNYVDLINNN